MVVSAGQASTARCKNRLRKNDILRAIQIQDCQWPPTSAAAATSKNAAQAAADAAAAYQLDQSTLCWLHPGLVFHCQQVPKAV
jgi:hypothetical protein